MTKSIKETTGYKKRHKALKPYNRSQSKFNYEEEHEYV